MGYSERDRRGPNVGRVCRGRRCEESGHRPTVAAPARPPAASVARSLARSVGAAVGGGPHRPAGINTAAPTRQWIRTEPSSDPTVLLRPKTQTKPKTEREHTTCRSVVQVSRLVLCFFAQ